jgi:prepilin-type N-terminal cleavage/methylation domain-containing protein
MKPQLRPRQAFTLVEVMVAVAVIGVLFGSLYVSFSSGFTYIRLAREDLRATQIMVQRMDTLRLYTWTQFQDPTYLKSPFVDYFTPSDAAVGTTYYGTIAITQPTNMGAQAYLNDIKTVTISLQWTNGVRNPVPHQRSMQTQVARFGVQNYIYGYRNN